MKLDFVFDIVPILMGVEHKYQGVDINTVAEFVLHRWEREGVVTVDSRGSVSIGGEWVHGSSVPHVYSSEVGRLKARLDFSAKEALTEHLTPHRDKEEFYQQLGPLTEELKSTSEVFYR